MSEKDKLNHDDISRKPCEVYESVLLIADKGR